MRRSPALVLVALALVGAACGGDDGAGADSSDGRLDVVAGFAPLAELARQVGGDDVRVTDLTPPGAEPHDVELGTDDVDALQSADVVLLVGGGFQPAAEEAAASGDAEVVTLLDRLPDGGDDPHVWLDPVAWADAADVVADELASAHPDGASGYRQRAAAAREEIEGLHARFESTLATCRRRTIVTAHDAFGRLADRYSLRQEPIAGATPEGEASPARLAEVVGLIRREGLTTVFAEPLLGEDVVATVAREAGVGTAVLDPVETLADGSSWVAAMDANLAALAAALDCRSA